MRWIHDRLCKWLGIWDLEYRMDKQRTFLRVLEGELNKLKGGKA